MPRRRQIAEATPTPRHREKGVSMLLVPERISCGGLWWLWYSTGTAAQGLCAAMAWRSVDAGVQRRLRDGYETQGDRGAKKKKAAEDLGVCAPGYHGGKLGLDSARRNRIEQQLRMVRLGGTASRRCWAGAVRQAGRGAGWSTGRGGAQARGRKTTRAEASAGKTEGRKERDDRWGRRVSGRRANGRRAARGWRGLTCGPGLERAGEAQASAWGGASWAARLGRTGRTAWAERREELAGLRASGARGASRWATMTDR